MKTIIRTTSASPHFAILVGKLDKYLNEIDGNEHSFYAQYNKIDTLQNVVVVYVADIAVGCGAFKEFNSTTIEIKRMWTDEGHRNKGVASAVLSELET